MSDTGHGEREWRFYISDMLEFATRVQTYTLDLDQASFVADRLTYDATLRNLALIGESATRIPEDVRTEHPEIPWRQIIATRNRIIHAYLGIDDDTVWSIIQDDIPNLISALQQLNDDVS
ncbi:MAG: DUF86 domain-containing protein [Gammaproteobacteria bacterium]|nr:DUF86 domain-containing protein [Gammaproteobacteria bacterium]